MEYIENVSFEELIQRISKKFKIGFEEVKIGDIVISLAQIENLDAYIEKLADSTKEGDKLDLPFWAKLWPSSLLLSYALLKLPVQEDAELLEIGAGIGLCGLVAAKRGFNVIISDIDEDALIISKLNILKNGLEERANVKKIDFTKHTLDKRFSYIIGSEVLYRRQHYRPLIKFFLRHLKDNSSKVILAKDYHIKAKKFFKLAEEHFNIQQRYIGYKEIEGDSGEKHLCSIITLTKKS